VFCKATRRSIKFSVGHGSIPSIHRHGIRLTVCNFLNEGVYTRSNGLSAFTIDVAQMLGVFGGDTIEGIDFGGWVGDDEADCFEEAV
jgi:hypothetical protein